MSLRCMIGLHKWVGCKCTRCNTTRDEAHDWAEDCEECSVCGTTRPQAHRWAEDCEECSVCGTTRPQAHRWLQDCEECSRCGTTRPQAHDWAEDCEKCSVCLTTRPQAHHWAEDCEKCSVCGTTRSQAHDWAEDCRACSLCGMTRDHEHDWSQGCGKCSRCRQTPSQAHDWAEDCEKCAVCGTTRDNAHSWDRCTCSTCRKTVHAWGDDCEMCSVCGATRKFIHGGQMRDGERICTRCNRVYDASSDGWRDGDPFDVVLADVLFWSSVEWPAELPRDAPMNLAMFLLVNLKEEQTTFGRVYSTDGMERDKFFRYGPFRQAAMALGEGWSPQERARAMGFLSSLTELLVSHISGGGGNRPSLLGNGVMVPMLLLLTGGCRKEDAVVVQDLTFILPSGPASVLRECLQDALSKMSTEEEASFLLSSLDKQLEAVRSGIGSAWGSELFSQKCLGCLGLLERLSELRTGIAELRPAFDSWFEFLLHPKMLTMDGLWAPSLEWRDYALRLQEGTSEAEYAPKRFS